MERQAVRDLDAVDHQPGEFQRRRDLECDCRDQRRAEGNRVCASGSVLCDWRHENLRQLYGAETPGGGIQMLHPFCTGTGGGHLRHGADDGSVLDCAGRDPDNHGRVRSFGNGSIHTACRDRIDD